MITDCIHHAIPPGQLGPEPKPRKLLIMGVSRVHAKGFYVLPTVLSVTSSQKITVLAICPDSLCFLPKGLITAQAFLLPESCSNASFTAYTREISCGWLHLTCVLKHLRKTITLAGLINTGADVTLILKNQWLQDWTILPALDQLASIGGH